MVNFFVLDNNEFLKNKTIGVYDLYYTGYKNPDNPNYLNVLKNTYNDKPDDELSSALNLLYFTLKNDIKEITSKINDEFTLCCVPRAKAEEAYETKQLLFKLVVSLVANELKINNGTSYIKRYKNTKTTHFKNDIPNYINDGELPYPGITKDTCIISDEIKGKNIILIDDIYTKTVNVDEDVIQALYDNGAKSILFYAVAYTKRY